jgi:hypothetical protein
MAEVEDKSTKPSLSVSAIKMLAKCGTQYEKRYIEGIKIPPGTAQIVGIATHQTVNADLKEKKDKGELLPSDVIADRAAQGVKGTWDQGVVFTPDEKKEGIKKIKGAAIDDAVSLSRLHHGEMAPKIEPLELERWFRIELMGYDFDLTGRMDIEEVDGSIRDTKTSKRSPTQKDVDADDQLTIYSLAKNVVEGAHHEDIAKAFAVANRIQPRKLYMDYLVKTKVQKVVTIETRREPKQMFRIFRLIEKAVEVHKTGVFMPNPNGWWCSKSWCGYWNQCPFFSGRE